MNKKAGTTGTRQGSFPASKEVYVDKKVVHYLISDQLKA